MSAVSKKYELEQSGVVSHGRLSSGSRKVEKSMFVCYLLVAELANDHKLDGLAVKFILFSSGGQRSEVSFTGLKSRCHGARFFLENPGRILLLSLEVPTLLVALNFHCLTPNSACNVSSATPLLCKQISLQSCSVGTVFYYIQDSPG